MGHPSASSRERVRIRARASLTSDNIITDHVALRSSDARNVFLFGPSARIMLIHNASAAYIFIYKRN